MTTPLAGYTGTITTNDTFPLTGAQGPMNQKQYLTVELIFGTYNGTVLIQTRRRGSGAAFATAAYTTRAGAVSSAGIIADATVTIEFSGMEVALNTASSTTGTLTWGITPVDQG